MPTAGSPDRTQYVTAAEATSYHAARGNTAWTGTDDVKNAALIRGSAAIDAKYGGKFTGQKTGERSQQLAWPRELWDGTYVTDQDGFDIMPDEIPQEICDATCEAALRELVEPGSMLPDLERGGAITGLKAGSVEIDYATNAPAKTTFSIIDGILSGLLGNVSTGGVVFARAARA